MTTKKLKNELKNNKIEMILENEWRMVKNTNSRLGSNIHINNIYNVDKWEEFKTEDEAIKFFMSKISYFKSIFKRKNITRNVEIIINK